MSAVRPPVIIAKNVLVWLSQLSSAFGQSIHTLDGIPDQELDLISERGFTVIWLIGVWERSPASAALKTQSGFLHQTASAYAVRDYRIERTLGGRIALEALKRKCSMRGLQLACDFLPNHDAMDSKWMRYHPEWFISTTHLPFENYRFTGQNLSSDADLELYIEDGYADQSDAAVVFRAVDNAGLERFVYHGNDGTNIPWNDTAQIDLSQHDVRAAVIDRLISVASLFPIIRIDAAMTSSRDQFRRLWFPSAEDTGPIPSRPRSDPRLFEKRFPTDFWPEALARLEKERPGTLIIGEVMWRMEPFFLQELGFHTVYDNTDIPSLISGSLGDLTGHLTTEISDGMTDRYVRFLQNPDKPAVAESIGTGDRYYGLCSVLAALPGVPLFGHGQIEGTHHQYSMSAERHDPSDMPDLEALVMHEQRVFPLLRDRRLFSVGDGFGLLEFKGTGERVLAFENTSTEPVVFAYNDSEKPCSGTIEGVFSGLDLGDDDAFVNCRNIQTGERTILSVQSVLNDGIPVDLDGYGSVAYSGFSRTLRDRSGLLTSVSKLTGSRSTTSLSASSAPIMRRIGAAVFADQDFRRALFRADHRWYLGDALSNAAAHGADLLNSFAVDYAEVTGTTGLGRHREDYSIIAALNRLQAFCGVDGRLKPGPSGYFRRIYGLLSYAPALLSAYSVVSVLYAAALENHLPADIILDRESTRPLTEYVQTIAGKEAAAVIPVLGQLIKVPSDTGRILRDQAVLAYLRVNSYGGSMWLDKDRFCDLIWWTYSFQVVNAVSKKTVRSAYRQMKSPYERTVRILDYADEAEYRYEAILSFVDDPGNWHTPA